MLLKQRLYQFDDEIVNVMAIVQISEDKKAVVYISMTDETQTMKLKSTETFEKRAIEISFEKINNLITQTND